MHRITALLLGLAAAGGLTACSDRDPSTGTQDRTARVQFFNATADASALTVRVEEVDRATAIGIGGVSPCVTLESGVAEVTFLQPGAGTPVASTVTNFAAGGRYIVLASGAANNARVIVVETGGTSPPAASTTLRLVNAASTLPSIDVYVTASDGPLSNPSQSGLASHTASPAFVVSSGTARVRITTAGTSTLLFDQELTLPGGQFRTLVITEGTQGSYQLSSVERCS